MLAIEIRPASKVLAAEAGSLRPAAPDAPPIDPADYADEDVDDAANPEWTDADFERARPLDAISKSGAFADLLITPKEFGHVEALRRRAERLGYGR